MRPIKNSAEITVIGGGLAGLSAACHAARLGRLVTLFEGAGMFGGLVATVDHVDGLAVPGKFSGQDIAIHLLEAARKAQVQIIETAIAKVETGKSLLVTDIEHKTYKPKVLIIASGASLRKLGVPGEEEFTGRGVSRCATCDGGFFRGQDVVVVGGGDAAIEEALVLTKLCRTVTMVCRSPLKAKSEYIEKIAAKENVRFVWESEVVEILGDHGVAGLRLRNVKNGTLSDLACSGIFPFVGVTPNSDFLPAAWRSATGHIETGENFATPDKRVFAVGAVRKSYGGNIVQAMAEGVSAAAAAVQVIR